MIVTKAVALVDTVETDDPNGAFEVILSAATLDRDGEVIDSRAFDPLPDHIPFDIDHGMTVTTTVGSGRRTTPRTARCASRARSPRRALAQEVRTLVSEGHVRTTSVTFMAADREPDEKGVQHVKTAELLNGTFTPVPSNREAVVLSPRRCTRDRREGRRPQLVLDDAREPPTTSSSVSRRDDAVSARRRRREGPRGEFKSVGIVGSSRPSATASGRPGGRLRRYAYIRGVPADTVVFDVWGDDGLRDLPADLHRRRLRRHPDRHPGRGRRDGGRHPRR
jgi:hypothetical protein